MNEYQKDILKGLIGLVKDSEHTETGLGLSHKDRSVDFWTMYPSSLDMEVEIKTMIGTVYRKSIDKSEFGFSELKILIPTERNKEKIVSVNLFK